MARGGAKFGIKLMTLVISIPISIATRKFVEQAWQTVRPEDPARVPADQNVRWTDAVGWAALSAVGVVLADLIARRSAELAYQVMTGNEPPQTKPVKASRKIAQAAQKSPPAAE